MTSELLLDIALAAALIAVGFRAIHAPALFTAVVLYIAFGLLLSLVWVRLEAPDLALAEAAIGAGVTGALLLDAAGQMGSGQLRQRLGAIPHVIAALAGVALTIVLAMTVLTLADRSPSLAGRVVAELPGAGVEHPVTAVLLSYRGYDTWLEVGVLLVAAAGVLALNRGVPGRAPVGDRPASPVAAAAASLLIPLSLVLGGYLLWRGTHAPGGAFQAGAVMGAAGILLVLTDREPPAWAASRTGTRILLAAGFTFFLAVGLGSLAASGTFLEYRGAVAGAVILIVELGIAVSTAATLVLLFAGARGTLARAGHG
jgi:multisubunit Na+/H+ antiporter MnhB subunit